MRRPAVVLFVLVHLALVKIAATDAVGGAEATVGRSNHAPVPASATFRCDAG